MNSDGHVPIHICCITHGEMIDPKCLEVGYLKDADILIFKLLTPGAAKLIHMPQ